MHLHGVGLLTEGFRDRVEPFLKLVATEGAILAGGFSEPQSGGNWWYQASTATPLPGAATGCRAPRRSSPAGRGPPTCS